MPGAARGRRSDGEFVSRAQSLQVESIGALDSLVEHDLFGKPASTFPDHALAGRPADIPLRLQRLQYAVAQANGVALAALGELDDLFSDHVCLRMIAVAQTKSATDVGVGVGHGRDRFRFERLIFEEAVDGHQGVPCILQTRSSVA